MHFYIDTENTTGNYSYATFEESIGGKPLFISKKKFYLIIPVLNQGIEDLQSFNGSSQTIQYIDRSYYFFADVVAINESMSIREEKTFTGNFENAFQSTATNDVTTEYRVELEMGYNGSFYYGAVWRVKAQKFGILIGDDAKQSEDSRTFYIKEDNLKTMDREFLLNANQRHLDEFVLLLE